MKESIELHPLRFSNFSLQLPPNFHSQDSSIAIAKLARLIPITVDIGMRIILKLNESVGANVLHGYWTTCLRSEYKSLIHLRMK